MSATATAFTLSVFSGADCIVCN